MHQEGNQGVAAWLKEQFFRIFSHLQMFCVLFSSFLGLKDPHDVFGCETLTAKKVCESVQGNSSGDIYGQIILSLCTEIINKRFVNVAQCVQKL